MDAGAYRSLPLLVNLWSIDCVPCLQELQTWAEAHDQIKQRCRVLALNVDELGDVDSDSIRAVVDKLGLPFEVAFATPELVDGIEVLQRTFIELQQPLPVPSSLLLDEQGRVAAIYKGSL